MQKITLACTLLLIAASAVPAAAQGRTASLTVDYSDLDITTANGADALLSRIKHAADDVCGRAGSRLVAQVSFSTYARCKMTTVDNAVRHVDSPLVADLYGKPSLVAVRPVAMLTGDTLLVSSR